MGSGDASTPRKTGRGGGFDLTGAIARGYTFAITIWCASYPEWLRDGPCDATATGSPTRRMLVLTPAQRLPASVVLREDADGTDKMASGRRRSFSSVCLWSFLIPSLSPHFIHGLP